MKGRYLLAITLLLLPLSLVVTSGAARAEKGVTAQELFDGANAAYSRGDFGTAIRDYRRIERRYGVSASLLYNLGNALAAAGDTGRAVLNYERALRLAPGDQDIRNNLRRVRRNAGLYLEDQPLYRRAAGLLQADQWALLAGACLFVLALSLLLPLLTGRIPAALARGIAIASLLGLVLSLPAAVYDYRDWNNGVVVNDSARLLISPFASAASSGSIKAGRLVHPEKRYGDYLLVTDETGRSGWLHRTDLALITDLPRHHRSRAR